MANELPPMSPSSAPSNLPVGPGVSPSSQPADIFSDIDPVKRSAPLAPSSSVSPMLSSMPSASMPAPTMPSMREERRASRLPIFIGMVVLGLVLIGLIVWVLFFRGAASPDVIPEDMQTEQTQQNQNGGTGEQQQPIVEPELPPDTDGDGLTDQLEVSQYNTNPQSADTDADGLSDREELIIYATDPRLVDTDGDTFSDGEEVRNGYNPKGDGRLFDLPQQ